MLSASPGPGLKRGSRHLTPQVTSPLSPPLQQLVDFVDWSLRLSQDPQTPWWASLNGPWEWNLWAGSKVTPSPKSPNSGGSSGLSPSLPKTWCLDALLWAGTLAESAVHLCKWQHHLQDLYAPFWSHSNSEVLRRGKAKGPQGAIAVNSLIQMCIYASFFICSTFACSITQWV